LARRRGAGREAPELVRGLRAAVDQIRTTIEALGRIEAEEVPPRVRAQLLTAFRDWTGS